MQTHRECNFTLLTMYSTGAYTKASFHCQSAGKTLNARCAAEIDAAFRFIQHGESSSSLISLDSPFLSDPSTTPRPQFGTTERSAFSQLWQNPTSWAARGWYAEPGKDIVEKLRGVGGTVSVEVVSDGKLPMFNCPGYLFDHEC